MSNAKCIPKCIHASRRATWRRRTYIITQIRLSVHEGDQSKKNLKIPKGQSESYIEKERITQWPKEKVQKDKQRSTKHTYKTKDRVTQTTLKTGGELMCSGRVSSTCSTSDTPRVNLATKPVISHERGKDREVFNLI